MQIFESRICPIDSFKEDKNINYYWFTVYDDVTNMWWHETMLGYGCVQIHKDDSTPYFGPTHVSPAYRGKGIQRKLIEARLDWCRDKGYNEVYTKVDDDNIYSMRNVLACGFAETRRIDGEIFFRRMTNSDLPTRPEFLSQRMHLGQEEMLEADLRSAPTA